MFSACATSMETLAIGSAFIDGGFANRILATVSSHTSEAKDNFVPQQNTEDKSQGQQTQLLPEQGQY